MFAMLGMGTPGLRIFDVRNPRSPIEVAYFDRAVVKICLTEK